MISFHSSWYEIYLSLFSCDSLGKLYTQKAKSELAATTITCARESLFDERTFCYTKCKLLFEVAFQRDV
jgi:hypothetical protein